MSDWMWYFVIVGILLTIGTPDRSPMSLVSNFTWAPLLFPFVVLIKIGVIIANARHESHK